MATATSLGFSISTSYDGRGARQARTELTQLQKTGKELGEFAKVAFGAAILGAGAYAVALSKAGIASNDLTQRTNKALETTLGSTKAAKEQMAELRAFGKESPIQLTVWLRAQQQLLAFGVEASKVVPLLGAVQDAVIAAGGTEEEIKGATRALAQMASKGKLSAEELLQLGERGVDAAGIVGKAFGTTGGDIRAQITEGRISVDEFFEGFIRGSEMAFGGAAEGARQTFSGMVDRLKGAHRRIGEILMTPFVDPAGGGALVEIGNAVADAMNSAEDAIRPLGLLFASELEPGAERVASKIREIGSSITTEGITDFIQKIKDAIPALTAFSTGLAVSKLKDFLELVPGMQRLAGAASPLGIALGTLAATSPEFRNALIDVLDAAKPLVPVFLEITTLVGTVLSAGLRAITPVVSGVANVVGDLTENLAGTVALVGGAAVVWGGFIAKMGIFAPGMTAAFKATDKLGGAFTRLGVIIRAHPILSIVGALALVVGAIATLNDRTNQWKEDASQAFAEVESGSKSFKQALESMDPRSLRETTALFHELLAARSAAAVTVQEIAAANSSETSSNSILGDSLRQHLNTREELMSVEEDYKDLVSDIDDALAAQVLGGKNASLAFSEMASALNLSDAEIESILPELDAYEAATEQQISDTQELARELGNATAALKGFGDEIKAQTDPFFALIDAQQKLEEAQTAYDDAVAEHGPNSEEAIAANAALAKAMIDVRIAGEEASTLFGDGLPADFVTMAKSMGATDEMIQQLEDVFSGAADEFTSSSEQMISSSADIAAQAAADLGLIETSAVDLAANTGTSLEGLIDSGMSVGEALNFMAINSDTTKDEMIDHLLALREAGFVFSDDVDSFLSNVNEDFDETATTAEDSAGRIQHALEKINFFRPGTNKSATDLIQDEIYEHSNPSSGGDISPGIEDQPSGMPWGSNFFGSSFSGGGLVGGLNAIAGAFTNTAEDAEDSSSRITNAYNSAGTGLSGTITGMISSLIGLDNQSGDTANAINNDTATTSGSFKTMASNVSGRIHGILGRLGLFRGAGNTTERSIFGNTSGMIGSFLGLQDGADEHFGRVNRFTRLDLIAPYGRALKMARTMFSGSRNAFNSMSSAGSGAFGSLGRSIFRTVGSLVNRVFNNGVAPFWNRTRSAMFPKAGKIRDIGGFATGGAVFGPGTATSDSIMARLSKGEHVWTAREVAAAGGHGAVAMLRSAVLGGRDVQGGHAGPGFALGGFLDITSSVLRSVSSMMSAMTERAGSSWAGDFLGISGKLSGILGRMPGYISGLPSDDMSSLFRRMPHAGSTDIHEGMQEWYNAALKAASPSLGGYRGMFNWIKGLYPSATLNSGFRAGDPGYHGRGLAVDLGFGDRSEYSGGGTAKKAFNSIVAAFQKQTAELIWDFSPFGYGRGLWNGRKHTFNSASAAPPSHNDHIHWAMKAAAGIGGGGGASQWSHIVTQVLNELGVYSASNLNGVLRSIQQESGGNPNALNNYDINARRGDPSIGLNQVIGSTFNAYAGKYRSRGQYDPYANIYASVRYARSRYGSNWASVMGAPGGYAAGIRSAPRGPAWVGENGPELMNFKGGESVSPVKVGNTYNFDFRNSVLANERELESRIINALKNAGEKGRLRNINLNRR